jgi:hypothetical protein
MRGATSITIENDVAAVLRNQPDNLTEWSALFVALWDEHRSHAVTKPPALTDTSPGFSRGVA